MIQTNMERIVKNRTVLIIAHRLAAVRNCDRIIGIEDGRLVEMGTHDELHPARKGPLRAPVGAADRTGFAHDARRSEQGSRPGQSRGCRRGASASPIASSFRPLSRSWRRRPRPVRMGLLLIICAFVAVALAWSYFGRIDIIATAQGKFQPTGRVKIVQPLDTGKVLALLRREWTSCAAGRCARRTRRQRGRGGSRTICDECRFLPG